ncbi:FAD/NAD(P)-binding domain-containing protein [Mycena floridula]|nr:FAD/NAD(P)-binding domain-containing protein [Mycena floridula]
MPPTVKHIVIVGGGHGGSTLARALSGKLDGSLYHITLIDRRPWSIHLIASLRVNVSDSGNLENTAFLPYDRIFKKANGTFKQGILRSIEKNESGQGGTVVLENKMRIPYDALVLATGSKWEDIIDFPDEPQDITNFIKGNRENIQKAKDIVLVGGGAIGIELAGEIKDSWPNKPVTIIHGKDLLMNETYPDRFRKAVQNRIERRGVKVIRGDFVDEFESKSLTTRNGHSLDADLVLRTRGPKPNTSFMTSSLGESSVSSNGKVKVRKTLQLEGHNNIFALGDIVDLPEQSQAMKTDAHAMVVAANVISYLKGNTRMKEYKKGPEIVLITMGKDAGVAYVGFLWGFIFGDWLVKLIKGRTLLIGRHSAALGH